MSHNFSFFKFVKGCETMPEVPDLIYLKKKLTPILVDAKIKKVTIHHPLVLRIIEGQGLAEELDSATINGLEQWGPFFVMKCGRYELIINFMLTGRFQLDMKKPRVKKSFCFTFECAGVLGDDSKKTFFLSYFDKKHMGKVYLTTHGNYAQIPMFCEQGIPLLSDRFTLEYFLQNIRQTRRQVRLFIMDKKIISSIGNAYADEVLFDAKIHPKTPCNKLTDQQLKALYTSIKFIHLWAIDEIIRQNNTIDKIYRGHLKIRNKKGEPCPECGSKIRRTQVHGYDTFYCPECQPGKNNIFISR